MNDKLAQKLLEITEKLADTGQACVHNSHFETPIEVSEYYYPFDLMGNLKEYQNECKRLGYESIYQPIAELMQKCDLTPIAEEELAEDNNHTFLWFYFGVKPSAEMKKRGLKAEIRHFFAVPFEENGKAWFQILVAKNRFGGLIDEMKHAEILSVSQNAENQADWQLFEQAVETLWQSFYSAENEELIDFSQFDSALEDFATITGIRQKKKFKNQWQKLRQDSRKYQDKLLKLGFLGNANQEQVNYQFLLMDFLPTYDDQLPIDNEALTAYLQEKIGEAIRVNPEDTANPKSIAEKLENQTDYTMLNVKTSMDACAFLLCPKTYKDWILDLAQQLDFAIDEDFLM